MPRKKIDPEAFYLVRLKRPIRVGRMWLRPGQPHRMRGRLVQEHMDAIESHELVE